MTTFAVYLDESYGKADVYSVGGYVATVRQWEEFAREWQGLCADEGIEYLHKRELEHCQGQFRRWRDLPKEEQAKNKERVNKRACDIILRRVNAGFAMSVIKSGWESVDKGRWAPVLGESFYAAGVLACMRLVRRWADKFNRHDPIDYVFERGAEGAREVNRLLRMIGEREDLKEEFRLNSWAFASKKDVRVKAAHLAAVTPLQAADFLAYETYREMDNRVVEGVRLNKRGEAFLMRKALGRLLQREIPEYERLKDHERPTPHYIAYADKESLSEVLKMLDMNFPPPYPINEVIKAAS